MSGENNRCKRCGTEKRALFDCVSCKDSYCYSCRMVNGRSCGHCGKRCSGCGVTGYRLTYCASCKVSYCDSCRMSKGAICRYCETNCTVRFVYKLIRMEETFDIPIVGIMEKNQPPDDLDYIPS